MFLVTFRTIADSTLWLGLSFLSLVLSCAVMYQMGKDLKEYGDGTGIPPDGKFGFTRDELKHWYDDMGEDGCKVYIRQAKMDLIPFIFVYITFVGSTLVYATTRFVPKGLFGDDNTSSSNDKVAYILGITLVADVIETCICLKGCQHYPKTLEPEILYTIASIANQTKWISLAIALIIIPILFILGTIQSTSTSNDPHKDHRHRHRTDQSTMSSAKIH